MDLLRIKGILGSNGHKKWILPNKSSYDYTGKNIFFHVSRWSIFLVLKWAWVEDPPVVPKNSSFLFQSLTITGFNVYKYANDFYDSLDELSSMCTNGKIQPHENVVEGFENMPKALIDQLDGKSQGKTILRV